MIKLSEAGFDLDGLQELMNDLKKAIKVYPDKAEKRLKAVARNFKKDVTSETESKIKKHTGNLIKGYKLDKIKGYNENMSIDFRGTAPHFHLIENGHNMVTKDGKTVGWVEGKHIVKDMRQSYQDHVMPIEMDKLLKDIVKECDLD